MEVVKDFYMSTACLFLCSSLETARNYVWCVFCAPLSWCEQAEDGWHLTSSLSKTIRAEVSAVYTISWGLGGIRRGDAGISFFLFIFSIFGAVYTLLKYLLIVWVLCNTFNFSHEYSHYLYVWASQFILLLKDLFLTTRLFIVGIKPMTKMCLTK